MRARASSRKLQQRRAYPEAAGYGPCHVCHVYARRISWTSPFPPTWTQIYTRVVSLDATGIHSQLIRAFHYTSSRCRSEIRAWINCAVASEVEFF